MEKNIDKNDNDDCCLNAELPKICQRRNNNNVNGKICTEAIVTRERLGFPCGTQTITTTTTTTTTTNSVRPDCLENGIDHLAYTNHIMTANVGVGGNLQTFTSLDDHKCCHRTDKTHYNLSVILNENNIEPPNPIDKQPSSSPAATNGKLDESDGSDENCSNRSTSTDNLSFISESDLINDIVIVPNLISEDEISVNSVDCVYAYRGQDGERPNDVHDRASQDDETDFLEMDFDPDPPSEAEIFANHDRRRTDCHYSKDRLSNGVEEEDIKIPREIDKIAEVVELNNIRTRDLHDSLSSTDGNGTNVAVGVAGAICGIGGIATNQRIDQFTVTTLSASISSSQQSHEVQEIVDKKQDFNEIKVLELPSEPIKVAKYTGTKPKIKSQRKSTETSDNYHVDQGLTATFSNSFDMNEPFTETRQYSERHDDGNGKELFRELSLPSVCTNTSKDCKKCKFHSRSDDWSLFTQNDAIGCGKSNDEKIVDIDNTSNMLNPDSITKYTNVCHGRLSPLTGKETKKIVSSLSETFEEVEVKFVNIYTIGCGEKEILEALSSINITANSDVIRQRFIAINDEDYLKMLTISDYLVRMSKMNCNYKELIEIIRLACPLIRMNIEFFPNPTAEIETVTIPVHEILSRWNRTTDLREILNIRNRRFHTMNVLGKLANVIREFSNKPSEIYADHFINIPQYYPSGYLTVAKL